MTQMKKARLIEDTGHEGAGSGMMQGNNEITKTVTRGVPRRKADDALGNRDEHWEGGLKYFQQMGSMSESMY